MDEHPLRAFPGARASVSACGVRASRISSRLRRVLKARTTALRTLCSAVGSILALQVAAFAGAGSWPEAPPVRIEWQSRTAVDAVIERFIVDDEWIVDGTR